MGRPQGIPATWGEAERSRASACGGLMPRAAAALELEPSGRPSPQGAFADSANGPEKACRVGAGRGEVDVEQEVGWAAANRQAANLHAGAARYAQKLFYPAFVSTPLDQKRRGARFACIPLGPVLASQLSKRIAARPALAVDSLEIRVGGMAQL